MTGPSDISTERKEDVAGPEAWVGPETPAGPDEVLSV